MQQAPLIIDSNFPGGNILLDTIQENEVWLRQDLRDTAGDWFYWAFRAKGTAGREITFHFTGSDVLGVRGPAISHDGVHWQWLGNENVRRKDGEPVAFSHRFGKGEDEVFLAFCPPYTQRHFEEFRQRHASPGLLQLSTLCHSRAGRKVELLQLDNPNARFDILLTARHHACESMASYCLEGVLEAALDSGEPGDWFRHHAAFTVIPFMDKDGVEAGDQGKNRKPYDHNRDYGGDISDSIYPEVRALREMAQNQAASDKTTLLIDFHCPWIRGERNEAVYFVGMADQEMWQRVEEFSAILQEKQQGPLSYRQNDNLPFGTGWNTLGSDAIGSWPCSKWGASLPGIHFAVSMEIPYANANGATVTPQDCRLLGRDIAGALRHYLNRI